MGHNPSMKVRISCYPNNEIRIEQRPNYDRVRGMGETSYQKELKFKAIQLQNQAIVNSVSKSPDHTDREEKNIRPGWGISPNPTAFTRKGKLTLQRVGGVVDKTYDKNAIFLTGTLPGSTQKAMKAIADYSGYIDNLVSQQVRRLGNDITWFRVWELQKRGALHCHWCIASNDREKLDYLVENWKSIWTRIIDIVGTKAGCDMWEKTESYSHKNNKEVLQADAQYVSKSVGGYMSKYLSKEAGKVTKKLKYYPSRWWGCCQQLKEKLAELTTVLHIADMGTNQFKECMDAIKTNCIDAIKKSYKYCNEYTSAIAHIIYHDNKQAEIIEEITKIFPIEQTQNIIKKRLQAVLDCKKISEIRVRIRERQKDNLTHLLANKEAIHIRNMWYQWTKRFCDQQSIDKKINVLDRLEDKFTASQNNLYLEIYETLLTLLSIENSKEREVKEQELLRETEYWDYRTG